MCIYEEQQKLNLIILQLKYDYIFHNEYYNKNKTSQTLCVVTYLNKKNKFVHRLNIKIK